MSDKLLKCLKITQDLAKKFDDLADDGVKGATNANSHLEFGTEGIKLMYQIIVSLQKKGATGAAISDYKHADIPKYAKEVEECKKRMLKSGAEINRIYAQAQLLMKMLKAQDDDIGKLSKDKDLAKNAAAIKMLMDARKQIMTLQAAADSAFQEWHPTQIKFLDISSKSKVDELKSKLPMGFKEAMKDWEDKGSKFRTGKREFRKMDFADGMRMAAKMAV